MRRNSFGNGAPIARSHAKRAHMKRLTSEADVDTQALLTEQRRLGDEYRAVERSMLEFTNLLAGTGLTAASRSRAEAMLATSAAELMRLGARRLELDAAVSSLRPDATSDATSGKLDRPRSDHVQT